MKAIPAGRLRHRVELQQRATTQDGFGQAVNTWTTRFTVYGEVLVTTNATRVPAQERVEGAQMHGSVTHTVAIRFSRSLPALSLLAGWRVRHVPYPGAQAQLLDIISGAFFGVDHEFVILQCVEGPLDGQ